MKKENKEILLRDLSTRLPYGVECEIRQRENTSPVLHDKFTCGTIRGMQENDWCVKPYLRPLSSMTEEEKWDFGRIFNTFGDLNLDLLEDGLCFQELYDITGRCNITWDELNTAINWLNSHHFDYRGLIPMGLAIEVTEENNPYKE